jgi:hypothetical protein
VRLAHQFALESEQITADCVEASEFPDLAGKYRVYAVPKTVVNEAGFIEGALPEGLFLDSVLKAAGLQSTEN